MYVFMYFAATCCCTSECAFNLVQNCKCHQPLANVAAANFVATDTNCCNTCGKRECWVAYAVIYIYVYSPTIKRIYNKKFCSLYKTFQAVNSPFARRAATALIFLT